MSSLIVPIVVVRGLEPHSNADTLDFVTVAGWQCIVKRGSVNRGDKGVYFPIDSVLPDSLMQLIFREAKIKPKDGRVRTCKIRGQISQGLFIPLYQLPVQPLKPEEGFDMAEILGITKYEPPARLLPTAMQTDKKRTRKKANPNFKEYTDIEHLKWYTNRLLLGEEVAITEKIHGSSMRAAKAPTVVDTFWKRVKNFFGYLPSHEFCYGSRKVQLQERGHKTTSYYGTDIWGECCRRYGLEEKLAPGEAVYGEIYGPGIQKGYSYDVAFGHDFAVYDVQVDGVWLDHHDLVGWCNRKGLPMVPVLYVGPYTEEIVEACTNGPSTIAPQQQPIREGCVVRPIKERERTVLKSVSAAYLLGEQSEWH